MPLPHLKIFFSYYFLMFPFESWLFLGRRQTEIDEILKYCRKVYKAKIFLHIIDDHCSLFVMWGFECGCRITCISQRIFFSLKMDTLSETAPRS